MNFERKMNDYKNSIKIFTDEQRIQETIKKSIDSFCSSEQDRLLNYWDFLWEQFKLIRKRWWIGQFLLLFVLWMALPSLQSNQFAQRTMGIIASLFVILIIPELWKNKTYQSMEIEGASYYSLRQIYAARMLIIGVVDITLITFFCGLSSIVWNITFAQLVVQFILPMVITSYICFCILCSKYSFRETFAITMCILWSAIWAFIVMNEMIYALIAFPLWVTILGVVLLLLVYTIYRTINCSNDYWEVNTNGIEIR